MKARTKAYDVVKRLLDVVGALILLVITAPFQLLVALFVALKLGRPVLFKQPRPGKNTEIFTLYKFRTMKNVDRSRGIVTNEQRMTRFGQILRSTSLDELPSVWNILRGDMSLVGPRPLRVSYLERYSSEQAQRHMVRPGLTGLAQVRGRNSLAWDDRLDLDLEYVGARSARLDFQILIETARTVFRRDGVTEEGEATKSEFFGPQRTSRITLVPLSTEHLATRVEWLNDPRVRSGISISFEADLDSTREWFTKIDRDEGRQDWVGINHIDGSLVSMCGLQASRHEGTFTLYIYVSPELQRKGFGRDTMELMIAQAREMGASILSLETPSNNLGAIKLYQGLGFRDVAAINGGDKRRMAMELTRGHCND